MVVELFVAWNDVGDCYPAVVVQEDNKLIYIPDRKEQDSVEEDIKQEVGCLDNIYIYSSSRVELTTENTERTQKTTFSLRQHVV